MIRLLYVPVIAALLSLGGHKSLAGRKFQTNPPGVPVQPCQRVFFDTTGSGSTVAISFQNSTGTAVPIVDTAGVLHPNFTLVVPASAAIATGYGLTQTMPDSMHPLIYPAAAYTMYATVVTGGVTRNNSGTFDCSAGKGSGVAQGQAAPDAHDPISQIVGDIWPIGAGQ